MAEPACTNYVLSIRACDVARREKWPNLLDTIDFIFVIYYLDSQSAVPEPYLTYTVYPQDNHDGKT